jgi:hypothetical protein
MHDQQESTVTVLRLDESGPTVRQHWDRAAAEMKVT